MTVEALVKIALSLLLIGSGPLLTGCGTSCGDICDSQNQCSGAKQVDCDATCDKAGSVIDNAGCNDSYDEYLSCAGDQDDVCGSAIATACKSQLQTFGSCIAKYCVSHQTECSDAGLGG